MIIDSEMVGKRFNMLVVVKRGYQNKEKRWLWECLCDCGKICFVGKNSLDFGRVSCGCYKPKPNLSHGMKGTKEYRTWQGLKDRCLNKKGKNYPGYGGKGITVSKEWKKSFETFYKDMGKAPTKKHEIDRRDNNSGYSAQNCRWVDRKTNLQNKSNSKIWDIKGKIFYSASDAGKYFNVHPTTIFAWCTGKNRTIKKIDCNFRDRY